MRSQRRASCRAKRRPLRRPSRVTELPREAVEAIRSGGIDAVLLYSPRSARILPRRCLAAGLAAACRGIDAFCISAATAEALAPLGFGAVRVAAQPDQDGVLALLRLTPAALLQGAAMPIDFGSRTAVPARPRPGCPRSMTDERFRQPTARTTAFTALPKPEAGTSHAAAGREAAPARPVRAAGRRAWHLHAAAAGGRLRRA